MFKTALYAFVFFLCMTGMVSIFMIATGDLIPKKHLIKKQEREFPATVKKDTVITAGNGLTIINKSGSSTTTTVIGDGNITTSINGDSTIIEF